MSGFLFLEFELSYERYLAALGLKEVQMAIQQAAVSTPSRSESHLCSGRLNECCCCQ